MNRQEVRSPGRSGSGRERTSILLLGALIVGGIGIYLALRVSGSGTNTQKDLLPYQVLARTLPDAEQQTFGAIRRGLADAEAERGRLAQWPEPSALASRGIAPFAGGRQLASMATVSAGQNSQLSWRSIGPGVARRGCSCFKNPSPTCRRIPRRSTTNITISPTARRCTCTCGCISMVAA